ncbi:MAG: transporter substrate-binding domain-containing protein, partial [Gammaproteobacteria bacterium]|nr:transporter substrate-binding domain-containing protein [Gammaproteobacteria bacterium]
SFSDALRLLSQGQLDAVVVQELVALQLIDELGLDGLEIRARLTGFRQDFCFAVTDGDKELLAILNEGLSRVVASGAYTQLREKWLGSHDPDKIIETDYRLFLQVAIPLLLVLIVILSWNRWLQREIVTRRKVEQELVNEKQLSEEYANSLPGLFYVFDEQRFVRWNQEWNKVTGYSDEELGSRYGTDFFEGEDKQLIGGQMLKVFREGTAEVEAELVAKDGRGIPYYFTGLRKKIAGREHLVGLGIDITRRKQAELEKEQLLHDMDGRVKELRCMYGITEAIRKYTSLDDILYETVRIIPPGWHYPEYTTARIILD